MDVLNTISNTEKSNDQILTEIDKKIRIKHHKEKNKNKTCIYGILDFITKKEVESLIKLIKKQFGCSGIITADKITKTEILEFSGNHVEDIKSFLIEKEIATENDIKI
jgi:translation initiation factor 1 (eIF-1/SUI1)